ncbi:TNF receptor-associated factor 4a [Hypomesus transpacificus]|uniref:TNF receptor-associated factor 4a n=1 Tax=Hypomesus transpacificus TaxID=137520 RepID=UPI001F0740D4|nr:TNF receptor-associated factor 4a [Hypomesus transpacificus]
MPGFDYKFLEKPKRRFQCPLCSKAMREPVQVSTCGHRFCDTCLQEFLSEGVFKCPEDQLPLDYAKVQYRQNYTHTNPDVLLTGAIKTTLIHNIYIYPRASSVCTPTAVFPGNALSVDSQHRLSLSVPQNHQYHCPRFPVQCPNQCGTPNIAREDLANHVKENCGSALVLCPFKDAGCKHRCPKLAIGRHLEDTTKSHLTMMCNLVGRQRQEILEMRREMEELSVSHDGVLIWKLSDYSRKLQEAKLRNNHEFFSPPFYTHRYGYKLQVSAFLNGNGSGEGSHLSIYIRVLPGEYDNLLEWPFSYKVTFSILDQSDPSLSKAQHITETFNPDPNWKNFQKPCSTRNSLDESTLGFGYPKFISHEEIKKRNYVRDNSVFLKASIEIPQKIMA